MRTLKRRIDRLAGALRRDVCPACGRPAHADLTGLPLAVGWRKDSEPCESERCDECGALLTIALSFENPAA